MTIARQKRATEPGLRPAPLRDRPIGTDRLFRLIPLALILLGLGIGLLRLTGPADELYPVAGDSEKYHLIAQGFAKLYSHPLEGLRLWLSHSADQADLARYGFDSWVLQHAPAYTSFLGLGYLLPADDVATGRLMTVLLFAMGGALIYLLGMELFGRWAGLAAAVLYLFWPAHWTYAPAILTEIPVASVALGTSYLLLRTSRSSRRGGWFLGGVAIGILVLTKTTLRYLAIPMILIEFFFDAKGVGRSRLRRIGFRLAGFGATQFLWLLFLWGFQLSANPLAGRGDDWLWIYRGDYVPDRGWETVGIGDAMTPELGFGMVQAQRVPEPQQRATMYKEAFRETWRRYPGGMLVLWIAKAEIFWRYPAIKTFVRAGPLELPPPARVQPILALAALIGFVLCIGASPRRCLPAAIPIYLTLLHAVTHLVSRYNTPAMPFAFVYGAGAVGTGAVGLRALVSRFRDDQGRLVRRGRQMALPAVSALAGVVLCLLTSRGSGSLALLGPWLAAIGCFPLVRRLLGGGGWGLARGLVLLVPLAVLACGSLANRPDPDEGRITLRHPGDGVRLALSLPADATPERFVAAEMLLDLLPSPRGKLTLSVRLSGHEVARFAGRPPSGPEAFLLDEKVHEADGRYGRILRSVERHLEGNVRKQRGMSQAGFDTYRQWTRVPCDPAVLFADPRPVLEIVLLEASGASVDLFIDRAAPAQGAGERRIEMPAFFHNAYELSSYRFDALATDRILADPRLVRKIRVASQRMGAERFDAKGMARPLKGEPRMRLRGRLPGGYGLVRAQSGELRPEYLLDLSQAFQVMKPGQIRSLQADRDRYFDGFLTY